jgi:S-layer protein (TIGR01567 family)
MKKLSALVLATLMLFTVFSSLVMADNNTTATNGNSTVTNAVEIRGPVYNGSDIADIIARNGTAGAITMNADKFAAFFYDVNNNITTETLSIQNVAGTSGRTIGVDGLVYSTTIAQTDYKYTKDADATTLPSWGKYNVLGWFADKYIPLVSTDASKLAKLVRDSNDKYSLKSGDKLDLGNGYSLLSKQVDVNGNKVLMELDYNGVHVDDAVIDASTGDHTWTSKQTVLGQTDVPVLKVHVDNVFQGAVDSMAQVNGIWLIDFENPLQINSDNSYGKLDDVSLNGATITIKNKNTLSLTKNTDVEIGNGLYFKIADADALRFYAYKQETADGVYDVRGTVATGAFNWDASNFAGFFYDLKKDISTESLKVLAVNDRTIPENDLVYSTTVSNIDYQYTKDADNNSAPSWQTYPVIGFMAQEYVPLQANDASKLAKLVKDIGASDKFSLVATQQADLGQGYSLTAKQVDVNGDKVWLELDHDGVLVDDAVIDVSAGDHTWTSKKTVLGQTDVPIFKVHVSQVFQGAETSVAQIDGLWLIDAANAITIDTSASYGALDNVVISGPTIIINNKNSFSLTRNTDKLDISGQGMYFKVADANTTRYYPYIEETIGNGTLITTNETSTPAVSTPVVNVTQNVIPQTNITAPTNVTPTPAPVIETPVQTPVTPVANNTTATPNTPGFSFVPALMGLLAVTYFVRKNR